MAFIPAAECIRVVMGFISDQAQGSNVFHIFDNDPGDVAHQEAVLDEFEDWWTLDLRTDISNDWGLSSLSATDISVADGHQTLRAFPSPAIGLADAPSNAANVAMTVTLQTAHIGKSRRGRTYVLGVPEGESGTAVFQDSVVAAVQDSFETLRLRMISLSDTLVVASYQTGGAPRVTALLTPVTSVRANNRIHSQRRRTRPPRG